MQKLMRLSNSPFKPNLETFDDIVIKLHVPYSASEVTIQINPNIVEYQDKQKKEGIEIRQLSVSVPTNETKVVRLDFKSNNVQRIQIGNKTFEIKLMEIGKENIQGQDFPYFDFFVTQIKLG
jgi:hypothetical protein